MITQNMPQWGYFAALNRHVRKFAKSTTEKYRETVWTENIHWRRDPANNKILYNLPLINDWVATGGGEAHQRAIEAWLSSLPSNQVQPPKRGTPKNRTAA
jgi:hypothetical protein